ncbi:CHAT domain-containing protein [Streptomyces axinellae]|uniref:CHAT domain-containing protein n=1 Tax=Streptomyces axinellae TaxID=552788 RepID=A0ABP6C642_9ACTN
MTWTPFDADIERNRGLAAEGSVNAMSDLAMGLRDRHRYTGEPADLLEGIAQLRAALGYTPHHPIRHPLMANLSALLLDHFQWFGDVSALHEALARLGEALPELAEEDRFLVTMMRADTLILLAEHHADPAFLDDAIESMSRLPGEPAAQFVRGRALSLRYTLTDDFAALRDSAAVLTRSVRATPPDDPNYALRICELGNVLQLSAERTGDESVRERAIRYLRTAVAGTPDPSDILLERKTGLAAALRERGAHTNDIGALREGVALLREVLAATGTDTRSWGNRCENYLIAVHELVEQTGETALLDDAVAIGTAARGKGSHRATIPLLLGLIHHTRFLHRGLADRAGRADLAAATAAFGEVVDSTPYEDQNHAVALGNLGRTWLAAHQLGGDPAAIRRAVTALGSAVRATAHDSARRGEVQINYGDALYAQYESQHTSGTADPGVLASAGHAYREAAQNEAARPLVRIRAARAWADTHARAGQWHPARDAYAFAVGLLPLLVPRRLARADQQRVLAELDGLAADAAAGALWAGDPETAVRLLELGRGVLGGQVLQSRSDLSRLRAVAPGLAERLKDAFERLPPSARQPRGAAADQRYDTDILLRHLLEEARAIPGFADFLAPPDFADLAACAARGPVVLINVSRLRSDALIVRPSGVTTVGLPEVTPESVAERSAAFGAALDASTRPGQGEAAAQSAVTQVLGWLWDAIAEPVLRHLGHTSAPAVPAGGSGSGGWPRVWWSPVGRLALLPVHAAGRFPGTATVLDRVISCYTPTLRALRHARIRQERAGDGRPVGSPASGPADRPADGLVIVAVQDAPGATALRGVAREAATIAELAPATRLNGAAATVDSVRNALQSHTSAHFACHAASDPEDPSAGHLLLHDGPLSILDVSALDLTGARLAVLSACETSLGTQQIPDESLHLVSAFQLAGYPQVVGTLWRVNDRVARLVAVELHERLAAGEDVATALHHAVRHCRERFARTPTLWAAHLCSGQ